jgi:hypothetical protein
MQKLMPWRFDYSQALVKGATHLNVSEYELFAIAYRGWFKQESDPTQILLCHRKFKSQGTLPHWMKHYLCQLNARTHYMKMDHSQQSLFCWTWLSRMVVIMMLSNSMGFLRQMLVDQKFSLYC